MPEMTVGQLHYQLRYLKEHNPPRFFLGRELVAIVLHNGKIKPIYGKPAHYR